MSLSNLEQTRLFIALEDRDWLWNGGFLYAPHKTMWLLGSEPWAGDLHDFHERMVGRLQRNKNVRWTYQDENDYRNVVADTQSLVEVLTDLLAPPHT